MQPVKTITDFSKFINKANRAEEEIIGLSQSKIELVDEDETMTDFKLLSNRLGPLETL